MVQFKYYILQLVVVEIAAEKDVPSNPLPILERNDNMANISDDVKTTQQN